MAKRKNPRGTVDNPLKIICIAGLALSLVLSWGLVLFGLILGRDIPDKGRSAENAFARDLREYDFYNAPKRILEGENPEQIERRLSRLQNQVRRVEDQLSVLKRRRALALVDRRYIPPYAKAAREAAETYAYSAPTAAAAAEALLLEGTLSADAATLLKNYASRLSKYRFNTLELSLHVLAGNLENPALAAAVPGLLSLLSRELELPNQSRPDLQTDEFLLLAYRGEIPGASVRLNTLLSGTAEAGARRMAAEFFYDHNNPLKAAELFSGLAAQDRSDSDIARAADAMVLAGEIPGARNIWLALSAPAPRPNIPGGDLLSIVPGSVDPGSVDSSSPPARDNPAALSGIRSRSLYNLAASAADTQEEADWLEKLLVITGQDSGSSTGTFGVMRYTRLLETSRSIAILEELKQNPLLDLELLRRRLETLPPTRAAAEVWMLLNRHSENEALYEWAAWYFDHQKLYTETARLLKEAGRKRMAGTWIDLHRSFAFLREGNIAEGEKILRELYTRQLGSQAGGIPAGEGRADWRIPANLGRIQESRRAIAAALEYYEAAAAMVSDQRSVDQRSVNRKSVDRSSAAQLQTRISRCLEALGRTRESRRALEYALELEPDNLDIRRELRRFENR